MSGADERGFEKECVDRSEDGAGIEVDVPEGSGVEVEVEVVGRAVGMVVVEIVEVGLVIAERAVGENVFAEESDCAFGCNGFLRELSSCSGLSNGYR